MTDTKNNPDCFGLLYDKVACSNCFVATDCQKQSVGDTPAPSNLHTPETDDLEALAAAELEAEQEAEQALEVEAVTKAEKPEKTIQAPPKKKVPTVKKPAPKKKLSFINRKPFKELMAEGKITSLVDETNNKTYMEVVVGDGVEVYKSQIYHEKNLKQFAATGANPFKPESIPGKAFEFLQKGEEISFSDTFNYLKGTHPDKNDTTLMSRAADVLAGASFFGIAIITRKEGRQKFFKIQ